MASENFRCGHAGDNGCCENCFNGRTMALKIEIANLLERLTEAEERSYAAEMHADHAFREADRKARSRIHEIEDEARNRSYKIDSIRRKLEAHSNDRYEVEQLTRKLLYL